MLLLWGTLFCIVVGADANLRTYLEEMELIPDVFDENVIVSDRILTIYGGDEKLVHGNYYSPTFLLRRPIVVMEYDPNSYFTLVFFSPDWVSRELQNLKHFLLWMKTNIRGNDTDSGDTIVEYTTPAPFKSAGIGRGLIVLYKQSGKLTFDEPHIAAQQLNNRSPWSLNDFVSKYKLGYPHAMFAGTTSWDESVPKLQNAFLVFKSN